jgi:hypothetical protein
VGFGCGWEKLNVLQKRWFVWRLAALLILRRIGILVTVFCLFIVELSVVLHLLVTFSRFISVWGFETLSTEILLTKLNI